MQGRSEETQLEVSHTEKHTDIPLVPWQKHTCCVLTHWGGPRKGLNDSLSVFFIVLFLSCYYVLGWFYLRLAINFNLQFHFLTFRLTSVMITCSFFLMPVVCKKTRFCSYLMWLNIHFTLSLNAFVLKWNSNSHSYPLFILFDKTRLSVCQNLPVTNFDTETLLLVILHVGVAYCKCHVKWAVRSCLSDVH